MQINKKAFDFSEISINKTEIDQSLLNIDNKTRSNNFTWNGQFSPQFIEVLLDNYALSNYRILDPFLGSGTVLVESATKGLSAYGTELNPSAYYMSKCYELCNVPIEQRMEIIKTIESIIGGLNDFNLLDGIINSIKNSNDKYIKNTLSLLVILMDIYKNVPTVSLANKKWYQIREIINDLPFSEKEIYVELADIRNSDLKINDIDLVITSPPYINVFNYHQKYRRSVEALGFDVLKIARKEIGSNRKNRGNRFLTVSEYCVDMAFMLKSISNYSKENARFIFVVGRESKVLGVPFCNSEILYEIANTVFSMPLILRQERVFKNRFGIDIYEDILHFNNRNISKISDKEILERSQLVAYKILQGKINSSELSSKNQPLLIQAIDKIPMTHELEGVL